MKRSIQAIVVACCLAPVAASAHAFLDHAVPAVGATVTGAPNVLTLTFTQRIVPALSRVALAKAGKPVPDAKVSADAGDASTLLVRLGKPLAAGSYVVTWHVVSIDTHPTSGSYKFTIAP